MKTLLIILTLITTQGMASSSFTPEELAEFATHNFKMSTVREASREARPNRANPMRHQFRVGRATRNVKIILATRATRPSRQEELKKERKPIKLAKLF